MFPMLIPSVQTQQRVLWPGAPRQAGFQRVHGLLHALSHLARGAGPGPLGGRFFYTSWFFKGF